MNTKMLFIIGCLFSIGCATKPEAKPVEPPIFPQPIFKPSEPTEVIIDYEGLQKHLGMIRNFDNLGYTEKSFDTCSVGYGYPANRSCRKDNFVLIHFQLMCRDADESDTAFDASRMRPLNGRSLNWTLSSAKGNLNLDDNGFGQIRMIYRKSQRTQRLRLNIDNEVLYIRAGEMNRVVTPPSWCN